MSQLNLLSTTDNRRKALLVISFLVICFTAAATLILNNIGEKPTPKSEIDTAVNQAQFLYRQEKERGNNFSSGPCLSNALMPGWVADLVHDPRLPEDDLPQNQCSAYVEGRARHFVELDMKGNLVRAK